MQVGDAWEFRVLRIPLIGEMAVRLAPAASVRHMVRKSFARHDRIPTHLLADTARILRSGPDSAALRREMLRVERAVDWTQTERDLHLIRCPTLILWGDLDRFLPVHLAARFADEITHAEVHVLAGAGHSVHEDSRREAYPLLNRFLRGSPAAG
jgi:pimeloyl-ACP methyl ester carboxylesterase